MIERRLVGSWEEGWNCENIEVSWLLTIVRMSWEDLSKKLGREATSTTTSFFTGWEGAVVVVEGGEGSSKEASNWESSWNSPKSSFVLENSPKSSSSVDVV